MEYRNLGKSGLKISVLSFGSWVTFAKQVDKSLAKKLLSLAYDNGVNFFDNAEVYENGQSEKLMGESLKELKFPRDTYCVSSKVFWGGEKPTQLGLSRKHIVDACHAALKRFQLDYLDLFFCHRPDRYTPIEETVWTMNILINQGKILYWGTSEWSAQEIAMAHTAAAKNNLIPPTMEQPQYNMFERVKMEKDYLRIFKELGLGTTIWSPLASGVLTNKYEGGNIPNGCRATLKGYEYLKDKFQSEEAKIKIDKVSKIAKIARELKCSMSQLAIAWCLKNTNVSSVILGASKLEQLKENLQSINYYHSLTEEVLEKIEKILQTKPEPSKY